MTDVLVRHHARPIPRQTVGRGRAVHGFIKLIHLWIQRSRQRSVLSELNDERLRDLGLSREDVSRESAKRFWQ